jgi:hypothetical protein
MAFEFALNLEGFFQLKSIVWLNLLSLCNFNFVYILGDRACNDCNQNEICLLQVKAAVPFCAKIKDSRDPRYSLIYLWFTFLSLYSNLFKRFIILRGCGGWCSGHKELCRYVGAQTYQCVDDSGIDQNLWGF